jgi:predicted negative regulator of RcsB-dependent stress response
MDIRRYEQLKSSVDKLQREVSRAEGAHQELLKRLKTEFDCNSLKEAEKLLAQLKKDSAKAAKSYEDALMNFQNQWGDVLGLSE